jgi:hypothetical protein
MLEDAAGYDPRRKSGRIQDAVVRPADISPTRVGAMEEAICAENNIAFLTPPIRKQNFAFGVDDYPVG